MKTSIYIEDGVVQLVITPECEFETNALTMFKNKPLEVKLFEGSFYDCRGGWVRQKEYYPNQSIYGLDKSRDDMSLILRINTKKEDNKSDGRVFLVDNKEITGVIG